MSGGLISYGDALKAFRRGVYQFPFEWKALVFCGAVTQAQFALEEAERIFSASSLKVEAVEHTRLRITVERGGVLDFGTPHLLHDRIKGVEFPQIICVADQMDDRDRAALKRHNRSTFIDDKFVRWDESTL